MDSTFQVTLHHNECEPAFKARRPGPSAKPVDQFGKRHHRPICRGRSTGCTRLRIVLRSPRKMLVLLTTTRELNERNSCINMSGRFLQLQTNKKTHHARSNIVYTKNITATTTTTLRPRRHDYTYDDRMSSSCSRRVLYSSAVRGTGDSIQSRAALADRSSCKNPQNTPPRVRRGHFQTRYG